VRERRRRRRREREQERWDGCRVEERNLRLLLDNETESIKDLGVIRVAVTATNRPQGGAEASAG
jgi:hypothetical protein